MCSTGNIAFLHEHALMNALEHFVPYRIFKLLDKADGSMARLGDQKELKLSVMFSDIRNFSAISETLKPKENFDFINSYFSRMDAVIDTHNGIINKFLGDGIMAIFPSSADGALKCSISMQQQLKIFNKSGIHEQPVKTGIGLNTGLCVLGIVGGKNRMEATVIGDIVNIASRIESLTKRYGVEILIGESTLNSLSDIGQYHIRLVGHVQVKGLRSSLSIYEVFDSNEEEVKALKMQTKSLFEEALAHYHYRRIDVAEALFTKCFEMNPHDRPVRYYLDRCKEYFHTHYHEGTRELFLKQMNWSSDFEIGYPKIDGQHRELYQQCIKLQESVRSGSQMAEMDDVIRFLNYYVNEHFKTEEEFLESMNYPFIEHHINQHRNFIKGFEILKQEIADGMKSKTYLMFKIQTLLIDWVINHTLREDLHYAKYGKSHSASLPG